MSLSVRLAGIVASGLLLAPGLTAQRTAAEPLRTWAITGARVVPVSGSTLERGTIVVRGGVISAVGANVAVPADAQVIDGAGLTVYPGFIDSYSSLGMPSGGGGQAAAGAAAAQAAAAARPNLAPNSTYGAGLQPEITAASALTVEFNTFDQARAAGLTAALTAPSGGVFRGQSAVVALGTGAPAALVVASPVAQHLGFSRGGGGFGGGGGGYPGSLLGVMAQFRQQLLDAQHYGAQSAAYARNPRGMARPAHDPSLEALQPVIRGEQPVIFFANTEREILRALDLGKEFGLKLMVAGGNEAWKVADRLKAENVPVLLSVNFPRRTAQGGGGGFGGGGGGAAAGQPEALSLLTTRVEQPLGPKRLADAGVRFVLQPGANYTEFVNNLRRAVSAGLPADRALRAVTLGPAELLGVADRMGSIETGKIANLTITTGDIFQNGTRVSRIFVDGVPFEFAAPAAPAASTPTQRTQ